uniref:Uncharacterized protein n=1 Tax=Sciurus vulgaris TaxID=55149 RepID=A0A8D2DLM0_SCIVU
MLSCPSSDRWEPPSRSTMHLYVLLACVLWGSESNSSPVKVAAENSHKNHTALCAEIQKELSADNNVYEGSFSRPQNTSEELCYGEFTKNFTSTLKDLAAKYKHRDHHITKVYKDIKLLAKICPKLEVNTPKDCTIEQSDFSKFKEALESVIISIEGWKSCQRTGGDLWHLSSPEVEGTVLEESWKQYTAEVGREFAGPWLADEAVGG